MVTSITAYLSRDGQVHRNLEEAEFCDYNLIVRQDIKRFLSENGISDPDSVQGNLLAKWELWRLGGYAGWLAGLKGEAAPPAQAELPHLSVVETTPAPAPAVVAEPEVARRPPRTALTAVAPEKAGAFRRRVAVVALPVAHHRTIEKEFGDEFKLLLLDYANSMQKLESLKLYHKVIVMTRHAHPKTVQILRGIGQEPLQLSGDLDNLRETLTAMYLATAA